MSLRTDIRPSLRFKSCPTHSGIAIFAKTLWYMPVPGPFMFRTIVKRHAMTGSRLDRYAETRPAPGFSGDGGARAGNN
ncbi:MAG: hypothetical protein M0R30_03915 [Methanoregula sp.]|uniref:hypothetical protein n=1 Tax=Methanoregula sp. TaxID=2052170 RepID=UPI0025F98373|nr:hypothetical protein [Methanoregula sp.]MCK9630767.1 hypothetical protein [Methanoregula sp.]